MVCRLFGEEQLSEYKVVYCQLGSMEYVSLIEIEKFSFPENAFESVLKLAAMSSRPRCINSWIVCRVGSHFCFVAPNDLYWRRGKSGLLQSQ